MQPITIMPTIGEKRTPLISGGSLISLEQRPNVGSVKPLATSQRSQPAAAETTITASAPTS